MEMSVDGFLEELLALRRETWESNPSSATAAATDINGFFSTTTTTWTVDGLDSSTSAASILPNSTSYESLDCKLDCSSFSWAGPEPLMPSGPGLDLGPAQEYSMSSMMEESEGGGGGHVQGTCKPEPVGEIPTMSSATTATFNVGLCMEMERNSTNVVIGKGNNKVKKVEGQPSKNLMAERRRRKRLNDRLSMLRSVVPKISKMDRTSILGDTIDYMKELLERINNLQEEVDVGSNDQINVLNIFKDVQPHDVQVRNSPKFDVERRNMDTRVEICCSGKPGLLLSTMTTLEALGLEIQQCVISCFNDFSLQASCSEEMEQRTLISSEDIKQALFRNAGYGGRCL